MTRFRMFGIHLEQFAILTDKSQTDALSMNTEVNFKYAEEGEKIACYAKFDFSEEQQIVNLKSTMRILKSYEKMGRL